MGSFARRVGKAQINLRPYTTFKPDDREDARSSLVVALSARLTERSTASRVTAVHSAVTCSCYCTGRIGSLATCTHSSTP